MKECTKCHDEKRLDAFPDSNRGRNGKSSWCRDCTRAYAREYARARYGWKPRQPLGPRKRCPHCEREFPRESFKGRGWCNECSTARVREYTEQNRAHVNRLRSEARARDPEKYRRRDTERHKRDREKRLDQSMRRRFGIGRAEFDGLLAAQGGGCAVCGGTRTSVDSRTGLPRRLHIDHDHETGVIRGILCDNCNKGLGCFGDDPKRLRRAIRYLARPSL